jgi:hypothetical protein
VVDGAERFGIVTVHQEKGTNSEPYTVVEPAVVGGMKFSLADGAVNQGHRYSRPIPPSPGSA